MIKENTKLRKINFVSSIFFILVAIFYFGYEKSTFSKQETVDVSVPVVSVSDGDTVILIISGHKEKVRLIGIDAPELAQKQWGEKAKRYLEALLRDSAWKVKLEYDVEKRDKYGRILAYLRTSDGKLINLLMVKNGYAMLYTVPPNVKHVRDLKAAQEEARQAKLGIWSEEGLKERPKDYRMEHPRM